MVNKVKKTLRLDPELTDKIEEFRKENNLDNFTQAAEKIFREYFNQDQNDIALKINQMSKQVSIMAEMIGEDFYIQDIKSVLHGTDSLAYKSAARKVEGAMEKSQVKRSYRR